MFSIRVKLISALVLASILVGVIVLLLTPSMVEHEIKEKALRTYMNTFEKSIAHYIQEHQSWGSSEDAVGFANSPDFHLVEQITGISNSPVQITLLDQNGHVLRAGSGQTPGEMVDLSKLDDLEPIHVSEKTVGYVYSDSDIPLSPQEETYVHILEETILFSVLIAIGAMLPFGIWKGNRLVYTLRHLISAVNDMADGNLKQQVPINTKDEIGVLANAFNSMNAQLVAAYNELETSKDMITQQAEKLKELSIKDELTGLYNRRFFNEEVQILIATAVRYKQPFSLVLGDIDHFKKVNDNFSHSTGDAVLREVADILQRGIRKSDVVARFGGEEMVLALPNTQLSEANELMDRIRKSVEQHPWHEISEGLQVTMSFGISAEVDTAEYEQLLEKADEQLYRAKREGRNRVCSGFMASLNDTSNSVHHV